MCFAWDVSTPTIFRIVLAEHLFEFFRCSDASHVESHFFVPRVALGILDAKFPHQQWCTLFIVGLHAQLEMSSHDSGLFIQVRW